MIQSRPRARPAVATVLVETSAWVAYLRDDHGRISDAVASALAGGALTCDAIRMELLAGARNEVHVARLRALLGRAHVVPTNTIDYQRAALLYRTCRQSGSTVRNMINCLIAAIAIRNGAEVLHADRDFTALARHTQLRVHPASLN
ncbi:type II toxin-antitoxin system VapC family toxin [Candidatus Poriferisodalis sp.]|uniref:type II toxin-antitoxin system VapC family toxin n=1 Tax=Candidatus Poriferisodalis sp. TaxID=3101277 RepID=UPI003D0F918F